MYRNARRMLRIVVLVFLFLSFVQVSKYTRLGLRQLYFNDWLII